MEGVLTTSVLALCVELAHCACSAGVLDQDRKVQSSDEPDPEEDEQSD
jgi:hypothetical protein